MTTMHSDVARLRSVLLKHPAAAYRNQARLDEQWRQLNYHACPDFAGAVDQYDAYVALLKSFDIDVVYADAHGSDTPDAIYVRDASVVTDAGVVLCRMGKTQRSGEPAAQAGALSRLGIDVIGTIEAPGRVEGGDVVWLDHQTLAIGCGYRTNMAGIEQLRQLLDGVVRDIVVVQLPHWHGPDSCLHLMSLISPVDNDLALVYSPLMPVPFRQALQSRGIGLVEVPAQEFDSLGGNVLALAPRRCVVVAGNPRTRARLEAAGVEVNEFQADEICLKGEGGPTCLTRTLERDAA